MKNGVIFLIVIAFTANVFGQMSDFYKEGTRDFDIVLNASNALENRIELNWNLENFGETIYEDNFDTYYDGDLSFGDWITIDGDGGSTYEFIDQDYHFPHPHEAYAWTIANWQNSNVFSHSEPNTVAALANMDGTANDDWLISPSVNLTSETGFVDGEVNFWVNPVGAGLSTTPEHIKVLVSNSGTSPSDFTQIAEFYLEEKDVWKYISLPLTSYIGDNIRIAINYCSDQNVCVAIDDFQVKGFDEMITGYKVYRTLNSGSDYEQIAQTQVKNYTDFFVTADQTYYYVVTAIINGTSESDYSNEASGYSVGISITDFPYSIDFEDITPPNLPDGCIVENTNGDAQTWETHDGGAYSEPNCLKYTYDSDNAADDWFFTPPLILQDNATYTISFQYRCNYSYYTEKMELMYGHFGSAEGMTTQIFDDSDIQNEEYLLATVTISAMENGPYVLGWHVYSDADQAALFVDNISITMVTNSDEIKIPNDRKITLSNYPNPFNPSTTISFSITQISDFVNIEIYNSKGQKVKTLYTGSANIGKHTVLWDGNDDNNKKVSSGIYLYKLNIDNKTKAVNRCLLLK